jgi:hypothetical protein
MPAMVSHLTDNAKSGGRTHHAFARMFPLYSSCCDVLLRIHRGEQVDEEIHEEPLSYYRSTRGGKVKTPAGTISLWWW